MSVIKPEVIVISSDDEEDGDGERKLDEGLQSEHDGDYSEIIISSDDEDDGDGERNLDEGPESEHDEDCIESDGHESDKEEGDDVEKPDKEECLDNCDDRSDSLNQGDNGLQVLSLSECKTYLRKHGMRVTGTKEECIQRIKEHERLKDGSGESLYPRSSFSINCTGDACRGDVVMFKQNMYDSQRNIIGRRTVAGRIADESYGASTPHHTFSVEVLWSDQLKKLNPLSILLLKGRNFYRFGTFRQPWESEEERSKVLREKHERGKAARHKRKLMETEFASGDNKGTKSRKVSHRGPYQSKRITRIDKQNDVNKNTTAHTQAVWFQNMELERSTQLTNHSDPNSFMYSDQHLQDASLSPSYDRSLLSNNLLPFGFAGYSRNNNEQQGPNQAFSQPPDHHHHNRKPPVRRSTEEIAKSRFPKSSFSINCTGDAHNGDIVLFKEHAYMGGNKGGKKRTVAGRIVKVRQCESKDKHKFLIKVLWTTPSINNRRPSTLLVRSHNLYKFGTFRRPWRNEANRSKMFKEKHGPATRKRKLKNTNIALDKNKGAKRQKGSHNETSQNAKQNKKAKKNKKAKQKSSKRKGASATPLKETKTGDKKKAVQVQKTKVKKSKQKAFHPPNPNLNTILNPSVSINPNLTSDTSPNPNTCQNPNLKTGQNPNLIPNLKTHQNPMSNTRPNPNANTHPNPNLKILQNPSPNTRSNPNVNTHPNPNLKTHQNPNLKTHQNPSTRSNPNANTHPNPNPNMNTHLNPHPNPNMNPHPNPNNYICPDHQQTFMPNPPPFGFLPNQPPAWFPSNQQPFGFPGYGGQWGSNHAFSQPPVYYDYNHLIVLSLAVLLQQQQQQL